MTREEKQEIKEMYHNHFGSAAALWIALRLNGWSIQRLNNPRDFVAYGQGKEKLLRITFNDPTNPDKFKVLG